MTRPSSDSTPSSASPSTGADTWPAACFSRPPVPSSLAFAAGICAWAGAAAQSANVALPRLLEAGANCLPVALLFLGLAALVFAVAPRATTTVAYGLVTVAFLWQLVGALLGAPRFLLDLSPFQHFAYVPAQAFRAGPAAAIVAIAAVASIASLWAFRRRDLTGP